MESRQQQEWIDRYLQGALGREEEADFEAMRRRDPALDQEVLLQADLHRLLADPALLELSRGLRTAMKEAEPSPAGVRGKARASRWNGRLTLVAAAATVALAGFLLWFNGQKESTGTPANIQQPVLETPGPEPVAVDPVHVPDEPAVRAKEPAPQKDNGLLAASYYRSPDFSEGDHRSGDAADATFLSTSRNRYMEALALKADHPARAATRFRALLADLNRPPDSVLLPALYLRGHTHFQLREFRQAAADFEKVGHPPNPDRRSARWYRALSLLALHGPKNEPTLRHLREIAAADGSAYQKQAQELLLKIQSR